MKQTLVLAAIVVSILSFRFGTTYAQEKALAVEAPAEISAPKISDENLRLRIKFGFNRREVLQNRFEKLDAEYKRRTDEIAKEYIETTNQLNKDVDEAFAQAKVTKEKFDLDLEKVDFVPKK